ncbi:MAG: hypothetical protein KKD18_02295 [Nanoarchaeota archaeon]|nr:hypothetical protein [Nanoarchaeota archaeon]MBU0977221.1 hypothetical protein [Nanoarchaeota archaeon]
MANVLLDTNIYGKIIADAEGIALVEKMVPDNKFIIHNFRLIRDELRKAPGILRVYDKLVKGEMIQENKRIGELAKQYFTEYKINGGVKNWKSIGNDFKIVACASLYNFDLIFSDDEKTLKHARAINAYKIINLKRKIRTPTFYTYRDLKRSFLTGNS